MAEQSGGGHVLMLSPCLKRRDLEAGLRPLADAEVSLVVNFSSFSQRELARRTGCASVVTPTAELTELSLSLRRPYAQFVSSMPSRMRGLTERLAKPVTTRTASSVWALTPIAEKNNKVYPTFHYACIGVYLRERAPLGTVSRVRVLASRRSSHRFFASVLSDRPGGATVESSGGGKVDDRLLWLASALVRRMVVTARLLAIKALTIGLVSRKDATVGVLFYTQFPRSWQGSGQLRQDRFLARLPDAVDETCEVGYLVNLGGNLFRQRIRDVRWATREVRRAGLPDGRPFLVLETHIRVLEVLGALLSPRLIALFIAMLGRRQRLAFRFGDIDLFSLMAREVLAGIWAVPVYRLYVRAMARVVAQSTPDVVVVPFFEYAVGRALLYGARDATANPRVIGIQHGCFGPNLLLSANEPSDFDTSRGAMAWPLADAYYVDGTAIRETFIESGYPADRVHALGGPRFDYLGTEGGRGHSSSGSAVAREDRALVCLATPAPHDADRFLQMLEEGHSAENGESQEILLKLPPNLDATARRRISERSTLVTRGLARIVELPFQELLPCADVVITSISTTGLEALALGKGVVCLALPGAPNLSPLVADCGVLVVHDPEDLLPAIRRAGSRAVSNSDFVVEQLGVLDGAAARRIARHMDACRAASRSNQGRAPGE